MNSCQTLNSKLNIDEPSGVVVPGEVGILLIYAPDFFIDYFNGPAKACT